MPSNATPKYLTVLVRFAMMLCLFMSISSIRLFAQQYVNGNLSTGATAKNGTAAPAGFTWSELQNDAGNTTLSNTNVGFGASITNDLSLADDFTVPAGSTWNVTKFTCYAYSTNYAGSTSPFTDLRVRIHNGNPSQPGSSIVFGDLTTNRLSNTATASIYRIGNTAVPAAGTTNTARQVWKMEANISVSLPAGTYWVEWQSNPGTLTSNFTPSSTIVGARTQPGYNAIQRSATTWTAVNDNGTSGADPVAMDFPFIIDYTVPAPGCAAGLAPANGSTNVAPNGSLSWTAAAGATSYDVYLGTSNNPPLLTNVTGTSYTFSPILGLSTTYYYKIVPRNSGGPATGCSVLSFTTAAINCNQPTLPTLSPDTTYCGGGSATLRITAGSLNDATAWTWYTGSCGGTVAGTGTTLTVSPANTTTYYVRGTGGCATVTTCAQVTVTKLSSIGAPVINPVAPICAGQLASLTINPFTLGTTPIPDSVTVNSGAISISVPDNVTDGAIATLTVPALPVGSVVTSIDVTLNMAHTYPGDMIFNLKAPNGKILNLYKYAGGQFTGNNGNLVNAGWFNTVIKSTGTRAFSSVGAPYNYGVGPYAPDALNTAVTGATVQNPNGYVSTETGFSSLYSQPNGTWTLAMADGGPGDLGTLTRWIIKIRYNRFAQVPSNPAVWTPATNLYTDAAGTTAYDGSTPLFQVYAKPGTTSDYTATSVNGGCISLPATATVTVYDPATITTNPSNKSVCEDGSTSFTVAASGTTPSYQWQVDPGTGIFANVSNGANYSGATTATLTISNAPIAFHGNKYRCVVTSFAPCTPVLNSNAGTLTVYPTPVVTISSPQTSLFPGMYTTIAAESTPVAATYNWLKDGSSIGETDPAILVGVDGLGVYTVSVVDIHGCSNTSDALTINDSASSKLFIYPNPNDGQFEVRFYSRSGNALPRTLLLYDSKGALVTKEIYTISKPYDRMAFDASRIGSGVYTVVLLDRSGKRLASGKVVIR